MRRSGRHALVPRSVYIHVPFCAHHCGYCNFTVIAGRSELAGEYLQAIEREFQQLVPKQGDSLPVIETLYFGGGTPTQLAEEQLLQLFSAVTNHFELSADCEITVEANPADVNAKKVEMLAALGVNRISLGVQSFYVDHLATLERDHAPQQIEQAVALLRAAGICSINVDLIFAVPGQSLKQWKDDLAGLLQLEPEHVSTYGLTFEKGTTFYGRLERGDLVQANESLEREMYVAGIDTLVAAGFEHYEVSNFAVPGKRSRHNEVYWTGQPYHAFGPGASRYVAGRRETNHRSVTKYLQLIREGKSPIAESEELSPEDTARERLVFGLRRLEGVSHSQFEQQTGYSIESLVGDQLREFVARGFLDSSNGRLKLTREGLLVSDSIWPSFL